jgi:hypothetical protein
MISSEDAAAELQGCVAAERRGDEAVVIHDATVPVESTKADDISLDGITTGTVVGCCC